MSSKISSGLTLSTDYFMRNYYINNRNLATSSYRSDYSSVELSFEDSRALTRAAKRLPNNDYGSSTDTEDEDIGTTTRSSIEAFVETYNNTIDSAKDSDDHDTQRQLKRMKTLTNKYADELEEIGVTINKDGSLELNEDLLKSANNSKARKLFTEDSDYPTQLSKIAGKLNSAVHDNILSLINTQNLHIDISV